MAASAAVLTRVEDLGGIRVYGLGFVGVRVEGVRAV